MICRSAYEFKYVHEIELQLFSAHWLYFLPNANKYVDSNRTFLWCYSLNSIDQRYLSLVLCVGFRSRFRNPQIWDRFDFLKLKIWLLQYISRIFSTSTVMNHKYISRIFSTSTVMNLKQNPSFSNTVWNNLTEAKPMVIHSGGWEEIWDISGKLFPGLFSK